MLKALDSLKKETLYVGLLTAVQIFNLLDVVILLPLAPTFMKEFSISPAEFSFLASSYNLSAGIIGFLYSSMADKFNRKKLLVFLVLGLAISTSLCGFANSFAVLLGTRIFAGFFGGIINSVVYAIIADLIPEERRGNAIGTLMTSFSITSILGIPLGLAIADYSSWRYTFFFIGIGSLITTWATIYILPSIPLPEIELNLKSNLKRLLHLATKQEYRLPYSIIGCFTMAGFMIFPFLSPYAVGNIGIREDELKYLYLVGGIFTVVLNKKVGKLTDQYKELKTFIPFLVLSIPFIHLYTSIENLKLVQLLFISTLFMMMINARFVPVMTLITKTPKPEERGGFMGILLSFRSICSSIAITISGFVIIQLESGKLDRFDYIGYISIGLSIIGGILFTRLYKRYYEQTNRD